MAEQETEKDKQILTQTAIRTFRKCGRLYHTAYEQMYKSVKVAEPLAFGSAWHKIREVWWSPGLSGAQRLDAAFDVFRQITQPETIDPDVEEIDPFVAAKLMAMLMGYHVRWCSYVDSMQVLGSEVTFEIPLVNPDTGRRSLLFLVSGQLDAVVRDDKGRLWVVEEKTAGGDLTPESPYWRRLEVDPQCSMYYDAVTRVYGEEPAGVKYFVNVKPALRPLLATPMESRKYKKGTNELYANQREHDETVAEYTNRLSEAVGADPERYYQMVEVARLERDIVESRRDVWYTAQAIRQSQKSGVWLRNPDSCIHPFGSACNFLPVCTNRASLEDPSLYRKSDVAHEELKTG